MRGQRIDFSCTWKENKKNDKEQLKSAQSSFFCDGFLRKRSMHEGRIESNVATRQISAMRCCEKCFLNLITPSESIEHHTFATLSSNTPLWKGNTRSSMCCQAVKQLGSSRLFNPSPMQNGSHRSPKQAITVTPSFATFQTPSTVMAGMKRLAEPIVKTSLKCTDQEQCETIVNQ